MQEAWAVFRGPRPVRGEVAGQGTPSPRCFDVSVGSKGLAARKPVSIDCKRVEVAYFE